MSKSAASQLVLQHPGAQHPPARVAAAAALLVALCYYLGAKLGFALAARPVPISMLWPPNALLLAAFLLTPPRTWPLLAAAALPAHIAAELQSGVPHAMVLGWFASNCSEALIGAVLVRAVTGGRLRFDAFREVGLFLLGGAFLAPLLSSFLDAALIKLVGWEDTDYWYLVRLRASSNVLAALTVVPLVLTWASGARDAAKAPPARRVEAGLILLALVAVSLVAFIWVDTRPRSTPALFYAPLPFLLWAAVRLGPMGIATANAALALIAIWGAVNELGPFVAGSPEENARDVQLFLIAVTTPLLLLAVLLEEYRRAERQTREQEQQLAHLSRVAMLGSLSGALAHELNQPLTAILSNAQAAQRLLASGRCRARDLDEILNDIVAADKRAGEVIGRLRALFRKGETQLQPLDVNEVARETLEVAHGDLAARQVTVLTHLEPRLPSVHSDRVQLEQVLLNLVINACEAMSANRSDSRVLTMRTARTGDGVQISVIDRGPGFTAGQHEKLFEPFYTTKPQGLGLGLSICRSIVSAHGGRLWGTAVPGRGAAFHVALPASAPQREIPDRTLVQ